MPQDPEVTVAAVGPVPVQRVNLECVTDPFGCVADGMTDWTANGAEASLDTLVLVLTASIRLDYDDPAFRGVFDDVAGLSALVALLLLLVSSFSSVLRLDPRPALVGVLGVVQWGLALSAGLVLAQIASVVSDQLAVWLAGGAEDDIERVGRRYAEIVINRIEYSPDMLAVGRGGFWLVVLNLMVLLSVLLIVLMLSLRSGALALLAVTLPILLAGRAGPRSTQGWLLKGVRAYLALCLAKPVVVLALRLSLALLGSSETPSLPGLFTGLMLIWLAAFSPYGLYRFFSFMEQPMVRGVSAQRVSGAVSTSVASIELSRTIYRLNGGGVGKAAGPPVVVPTAGRPEAKMPSSRGRDENRQGRKGQSPPPPPEQPDGKTKKRQDES